MIAQLKVRPESNADVLQGELKAISSKNNGRLTPKDVVDAARPPSSPLHPFFEWDDETAAESWRIETARELIRSVRVEIVTEDVTLRAYEYIRDPFMKGNEAGYVSIGKVKTSRELTREVIEAEFARVIEILNRTKTVVQSLGMEKSIESLISRINLLVKTIRTK